MERMRAQRRGRRRRQSIGNSEALVFRAQASQWTETQLRVRGRTEVVISNRILVSLLSTCVLVDRTSMELTVSLGVGRREKRREDLATNGSKRRILLLVCALQSATHRWVWAFTTSPLAHLDNRTRNAPSKCFVLPKHVDLRTTPVFALPPSFTFYPHKTKLESACSPCAR